MLNKILAITFLFLLVGKLFFRPQLFALRKYFDGVVNAMLIAIAIAYLLQLILLLAS